MKLVLLRHATRSPYEAGDVGLNLTGRNQAEALVKSLAPQGLLPKPSRLLCSPKRRAKETLIPVSRSQDLTAEVDARLDERRQNETEREFLARVREVCEELGGGKENDCVYVCSHLDWLEAAAILMAHDMSQMETALSWSPCGFKVFRLEEGVWRLKGSGTIA